LRETGIGQARLDHDSGDRDAQAVALAIIAAELIGNARSPGDREWIESLAPPYPNPECTTPNAKGSRQCRICRTASEPLTEEPPAAYAPYPLPSARPWPPWSPIPDTRVADPATAAALRMIEDAKQDRLFG